MNIIYLVLGGLGSLASIFSFFGINFAGINFKEYWAWPVIFTLLVAIFYLFTSRSREGVDDSPHDGMKEAVGEGVLEDGRHYKSVFDRIKQDSGYKEDLHHKLAHYYRDIFFDFIEKIANIEDEKTRKKQAIDSLDCAFCYTCRNIRLAMEKHISLIKESKYSRVRVSVKLLVNSGEIIERDDINVDKTEAEILTRESWVITSARDQQTLDSTNEDEREVKSRLFKTWENSENKKDVNTAFRMIFEEDGSDCFFSNDLKALRDKGEYKNETDDWWKRYNATIVVPIRYKGRDGRLTPFGAIAVDSLNKNHESLFDDNSCKAILGHAADLLALYIRGFHLIASPPLIEGVVGCEPSEEGSEKTVGQ